VWEREIGDLPAVEAAAHPATGGGWAAPAVLGVPGQRMRAPAAAVDDAGNGIAVFERFDGIHWRVAVATRPVLSGAWSAPVDLSLPGQDARDARVAVDGGGGALAVWQRRNGLSWVVEAATRSAAGAWGAPVQLSDGGADARSVQVALAPDGRAVVLWERLTGLQSAVQASVAPSGGGPLGPAATLSQPGTSALSPRLAMDAAGNAVAVWQTFDGLHGAVRAADRPAGAAAWSPSVAVSPAGEDAREPQIGLDRAGGAMALWSRLDAGLWSVRSALRAPGGGPWSAPATVSSGSGSSAPPAARLAIDASGAAAAIFAWRPPGASVGSMLGARRPAGGEWLAPVTLQEGDDLEAPDLSGDPGGDAAAVWSGGGIVRAAAADAAAPVLGGLTVPATATAGAPVSFSATALDAWAGLAGGPLWSFGDGVSVAGDAVGHVYDAPGVYPVTLVAIDALGNASRVGGQIAVAAPPAPRAAPTQVRPRSSAPTLRRLAALPGRLRPLVPATGCRAPAPVGLPPGGRCRGGTGIQVRFVLSAPGPVALALRPSGGGPALVGVRVAGRAGLNGVRLTGWARGRPLPRGVYRLTLRPGLPPRAGRASSVGVVVTR
jgi:hypothetical protein